MKLDDWLNQWEMGKLNLIMLQRLTNFCSSVRGNCNVNGFWCQQGKIKFASANIIAQVTLGKRFYDFENPDFVTILNGWKAFFRTGAPAFNVNPHHSVVFWSFSSVL